MTQTAARHDVWHDSPHRIGPASAGIHLTADEFDAIDDYDDAYRYELIRGVLVVSPIPSPGETDPNEELGHWLRAYRDANVAKCPIDGTLPEQYARTLDTRRRADRVIWVGLGRRPTREDVPAIVVEFVSEGKRDFHRDYVEKRAEYLAVGVKEYWIIDRFRRTMTVYRGSDVLPAEIVVLESQTYQTDLLPGFELPLAKLFAVADRWVKDQSK